MTVTIIGAGLAGLLAANMLRRKDVLIAEAQQGLPNNHHAVLRFRTDRVAQQIGLPFKRVPVFKAVHRPVNPVADALSYSKKVTGRLEMRSIISLEPCERFIAPPDLVARMAEGLDIRYGQPVVQGSTCLGDRHDPCISTMAMPTLMRLLGYSEAMRPDFKYTQGSVLRVTLDRCDVYATLYFPRPEDGPYRASITGDELIIEYGDKEPDIADIHMVKDAFGIGATHPNGEVRRKDVLYQKLGKLSDEDRRKANAFMYWATTEHNIYSLGRFATWRAGLLLDDVVNDVIKIEGWMRDGPYSLRKDM